MQYHPDHYAFCTNRDTGVALHVAVEAGDVEETRALLAAGASPDTLDEKRWTPLMRAARGGHLLRTPRGAHLEIMRLLLCAGANAAAATPSGWTALMSAAQ
ncbi:MAG: ankyrin repeat domain-containing protein, partial [Rhodocyclaceae bacterium]|nr:ankyrin repeat domain-containing protein [Rhodocyclaceae bacterium]